MKHYTKPDPPPALYTGLHITHLLSLDALLAVVNVIALQCQVRDTLIGTVIRHFLFQAVKGT